MQETYNKESALLETYNRVRVGIASWLGVILTVVGMGVIFVVASLEGTKEVKASSATSAKILAIWRDANPGETYPEEMGELISFKDKEYYFVIKSYKTIEEPMLDADGNPLLDELGVPITQSREVINKWYFAYDGGMEYVFQDMKFYVLTLLTIVISVYISNVNYTSTIRSVMSTQDFKSTLEYYKKKKDAIEQYSQYIPDFCSYKNKQAYETAKREIIENAGINYKLYIDGKIDENKLEEWQIKRLEKIAHIKVKKIHASDLLQEQGYLNTNIVLLPMSQREHQKNFLISGIIQKTITSALSGMVVAFGVVLGNWFLGLTYGLTVLISFISSVVIATDFVQSTLRNRYIAKADLLNEFYNIKGIFETQKDETKTD